MFISFDHQRTLLCKQCGYTYVMITDTDNICFITRLVIDIVS